jgi:hypothetical protein
MSHDHPHYRYAPRPASSVDPTRSLDFIDLAFAAVVLALMTWFLTACGDAPRTPPPKLRDMVLGKGATVDDMERPLVVLEHACAIAAIATIAGASAGGDYHVDAGGTFTPYHYRFTFTVRNTGVKGLYAIYVRPHTAGVQDVNGVADAHTITHRLAAGKTQDLFGLPPAGGGVETWTLEPAVSFELWVYSGLDENGDLWWVKVTDYRTLYAGSGEEYTSCL